MSRLAPWRARTEGFRRIIHPFCPIVLNEWDSLSVNRTLEGSA